MHRWLSQVRDHVRGVFAKLAREHTTPGRLGIAVGLGVLVGTTPFYGAHVWIAIGLATVMRLNRMATILGSSYSIPPLFPFIVFSSVQLGHRILQGQWLDVSLSGFSDLDPTTFGSAWVVGSLVVGSLLGALVGLACAGVAAWHHRRDGSPEATGTEPPFAAQNPSEESVNGG